jgi:hypothetical protein
MVLETIYIIRHGVSTDFLQMLNKRTFHATNPLPERPEIPFVLDLLMPTLIDFSSGPAGL